MTPPPGQADRHRPRHAACMNGRPALRPLSSFLYLGPQGSSKQLRTPPSNAPPPPVSWSASVERGAREWGVEHRIRLLRLQDTPREVRAYRARISHGAEIRPRCATVSSVEENNLRKTPRQKDQLGKLTVSCLRRCGVKLYLGYVTTTYDNYLRAFLYKYAAIFPLRHSRQVIL